MSAWKPTKRIPFIRMLALQALELEKKGLNQKKIGEIMGVDRTTINRWLGWIKEELKLTTI